MKHLLTAIACCLALAGSAQTPYNPDSDANNLMGAEDLMSLLSLYGGPFYPSTNLVIDTLDWTGIETDTLSLPIDADILVFEPSVCEENAVNPYIPCRRYLDVPIVDGFKSWLVLVNPSYSVDSIYGSFFTETEYLFTGVNYSTDVFGDLCSGISTPAFCWNPFFTQIFSLNGVVGVLKD